MISNNRRRTIASATVVGLLVFTSVLAQRNKSAQGKTGFHASARSTKPLDLPEKNKAKATSTPPASITNNLVSVSASANATSTAVSSASLGQVPLAWTAVTNATGYRIWRPSPNNSGFTAAGRSATANFVCTGLANGLLYSFVITSTNATQESLPSAVVIRSTPIKSPFPR